MLAAVIYINLKTITITIDGNSTQIKTFKTTVQAALKEQNIQVGPKDKIEPNLNSKISNNSTINIIRAVNVLLSVDDKELNVLTSDENVASVLKAEGIVLREQDKISPSIDTKLSEGLKIKVTRVDTKTFTESQSISFKTIIKNDNNLANTVRKTTQEGQNGEKQIITDVTYENGKEVSRKVVSENIVKNPVDKIVVVGTLPVLPINRGGDPIPYTKVFKARATAYSPTGGATSAYTASGRKAVRNPDGYSTIAVDPSVIPYGTKLFVQGYGFAIAADTGSAIKGNTIDVFFDTKAEALRWAVKYVNVYVLK
ncbi:ubiquitin-like domain-containing protein [Clostridium sp. SYSU_GA19001]|uniref:ubiquitin-like domain-containing protein n=1 Tax=Clostridium caldaquaticum TaxID=2940653 RepID=UPI00207725C4|nr:ubiquitin-like domain-containing protein [Clostridium caldaquaticum]MCM8710218.1 ubiquitin-like domain-containing protein [Clostridium caldaquaticum]